MDTPPPLTHAHWGIHARLNSPLTSVGVAMCVRPAGRPKVGAQKLFARTLAGRPYTIHSARGLAVCWAHLLASQPASLSRTQGHTKSTPPYNPFFSRDCQPSASLSVSSLSLSALLSGRQLVAKMGRPSGCRFIRFAHQFVCANTQPSA